MGLPTEAEFAGDRFNKLQAAGFLGGYGDRFLKRRESSSSGSYEHQFQKHVDANRDGARGLPSLRKRLSLPFGRLGGQELQQAELNASSTCEAVCVTEPLNALDQAADLGS
ncbi:hypothetical protein AXG93_4876s1050 [Marchantia polymorpha subsp. ruderalis]|uniref:Uncharacterized protein n=1 Tax=Marchantia polymorpha subsp. ruderalis TaxID=1480154 RepID=A0A176WCW1_MARPO|nr:hypothetical protein AXG93_4876s1050 [Marchantia polymorpha subsp. ruderalis]